MADVLEKIALLIGVKIEAPEAAAQERMPLVELTGPVRATLASLLQESSFDFLIQASETNRDEVQSVILLVREKSAGTNRTESAGRQVRSPFVRNAPSRPAVPESETAASSPVSQGENTLDAGAVTPAKDEGQAPAVSENAEQSDQTLQIDPPPERAQPLAQTPSGSLRPGALTPPPVLTPQAMSQQLLQMYQQRTQMMQQATGTNSTNK